MPITNEQLADSPNIVISRIEDPFDVHKDTPASLAQLQGMLNQIDGKLYVIADCRKLSPSFSEVVVGLAETSRPGSPMRNERIETIVVAEGQIFASMVDWYKQQQYGSINMSLYKTVDEAIKHARNHMAEG
jgi:hypothetical protein